MEGQTTGIERIVVDSDDTNDAFCIPFTADKTIDDGLTPPVNTRIGIDLSFNFNPFTSRLEVPFITSDLSGTATKVLSTSSVLDSDLTIPFLSAPTGNVNILTDLQSTTITYNPITNILKCPTFQGDLSGTATKVLATVSSTDSIFSIPFLSASTGNVNILTDGLFGLVYNPSTNILTSNLTGNVIGDLSGNVTGNVVGNVVGDLSGTATKVKATSNLTDTGFNVPFLGAATGSVDIFTDTLNELIYNPFTSTLTSVNLAVDGNISATDGTVNVIGNLNVTGSVTGNVIGNLLGTTINVGNTSTSTINIEGGTACEINIGVASILNTVNIGNNLSAVNITCAPEDAVLFFNPIDQMNGVF